MKMSKELYGKLENAMQKVVEVVGKNAIEQHRRHNNLSFMRIAWDVFRMAERQLIYDDSHPAFKSGQWSRFIDYDATVWAEIKTLLDKHIETAIVRIMIDIGFHI